MLAGRLEMMLPHFYKQDKFDDCMLLPFSSSQATAGGLLDANLVLSELHDVDWKWL